MKYLKLILLLFLGSISASTSCRIQCPENDSQQPIKILFKNQAGDTLKSAYTKIYDKRINKLFDTLYNYPNIKEFIILLPASQVDFPVTLVFEKANGTKDAITLNATIGYKNYGYECGVVPRYENLSIVQSLTTFSQVFIRSGDRGDDIRRYQIDVIL